MSLLLLVEGSLTNPLTSIQSFPCKRVNEVSVPVFFSPVIDLIEAAAGEGGSVDKNGHNQNSSERVATTESNEISSKRVRFQVDIAGEEETIGTTTHGNQPFESAIASPSDEPKKRGSSLGKMLQSLLPISRSNKIYISHD